MASVEYELQAPNFLRVLDQQHSDVNGGYQQWGFVVFRTAGYQDGGGGGNDVNFVKGRLEELINEQFNAAAATVAAAENSIAEIATNIQRAREDFRLMWFEEESLNGATTQELARRFRELNIPIGLHHSLCLCVDESSFKSIALGPSIQGPAHVLAISRSCGLEPSGDEADDEEWTGSFKVAISTLITELWAVVGNGSLTPYEIGFGVTEDLVWTDTTRFGRQKAAVQ